MEALANIDIALHDGLESGVMDLQAGQLWKRQKTGSRGTRRTDQGTASRKQLILNK